MPSLDDILLRVRQRLANAERLKAAAKAKARPLADSNKIALSIYQQEANWLPRRIHREFEIQLCDCCKGEQVAFMGDRVELHHRIDRSAKRFIRERGEALRADLPVDLHLIQRVIPECWSCYSAGQLLETLFKCQPPAESATKS